jgi:hypothetical protein
LVDEGRQHAATVTEFELQGLQPTILEGRATTESSLCLKCDDDMVQLAAGNVATDKIGDSAAMWRYGHTAVLNKHVPDLGVVPTRRRLCHEAERCLHTPLGQRQVQLHNKIVAAMKQLKVDMTLKWYKLHVGLRGDIVLRFSWRTPRPLAIADGGVVTPPMQAEEFAATPPMEVASAPPTPDGDGPHGPVPALMDGWVDGDWIDHDRWYNWIRMCDKPVKPTFIQMEREPSEDRVSVIGLRPVRAQRYGARIMDWKNMWELIDSLDTGRSIDVRFYVLFANKHVVVRDVRPPFQRVLERCVASCLPVWLGDEEEQSAMDAAAEIKRVKEAAKRAAKAKRDAKAQDKGVRGKLRASRAVGARRRSGQEESRDAKDDAAVLDVGLLDDGDEGLGAHDDELDELGKLAEKQPEPMADEPLDDDDKSSVISVSDHHWSVNSDADLFGEDDYSPESPAHVSLACWPCGHSVPSSPHGLDICPAPRGPDDVARLLNIPMVETVEYSPTSPLDDDPHEPEPPVTHTHGPR